MIFMFMISVGVVFGPEVPEDKELQANDDSEEYVPAPGLDLPSGENEQAQEGSHIAR